MAGFRPPRRSITPRPRQWTSSGVVGEGLVRAVLSWSTTRAAIGAHDNIWPQLIQTPRAVIDATPAFEAALRHPKGRAPITLTPLGAVSGSSQAIMEKEAGMETLTVRLGTAPDARSRFVAVGQRTLAGEAITATAALCLASYDDLHRVLGVKYTFLFLATFLQALRLPASAEAGQGLGARFAGLPRWS
jgi:hypothetical protein